MTLRRFVLLLTLVLTSLTWTGRADAQTVSLQAELLSDWSALKATMHSIAAEMPPDGYEFRPTEVQQTFGERALHVAIVNVALLSTLGQTSIPKPAIDTKATSREAVLKALDTSFDYGIALLEQQSDRTLLERAPSPPKFLGPSSRTRVVMFVVRHTWDLYGQMAVYLRLKGHVPPASKGM